jgi:myo-inositol-1(or 4)-monophosphatase
MPKYTAFIKSILTEAAHVAQSSFGKVQGAIKDGDQTQVLTETDLAIGKFLVNEIIEAFPTHNVLDEETGAIDNNSRFTWVVDPIDGTSNFAAGIPLYGIMVGLLEHEIPIAGGIALPFFSDICIAEKGFGTTNNHQLLMMKSGKDIKDLLIAYGMDGHPEAPELTIEESRILAEIALHARNIRSSNSVFDVMMLAKGAYGGFLNRTSKVWDNVAPQIILQEAGAIYTDFWGKPMDYSGCLRRINANYTFCAAAPGVYEALQKIIRQVARLR